MCEAVFTDIELTPENATREEVVCNNDYYFDWDGFCVSHPDYCWECTPGETWRCIGTSCDDCTELQTPYLSAYDNLCATFPEYAVDCDLDGTAECCGQCNSYYYYEFLDECVPPGDTMYHVVQYDIEDVGLFIQVEDSGVSCAEGDTDSEIPTEDTDSEIPTDTGSDAPLDDPTDSETAQIDPIPDPPSDVAQESDTGSGEIEPSTTDEPVASETNGDEPEDVPSDTGDETEEATVEEVDSATTAELPAPVLESPSDGASDLADEEAEDSKSEDKGCSISNVGAKGARAGLVTTVLRLLF